MIFDMDEIALIAACDTGDREGTIGRLADTLGYLEEENGWLSELTAGVLAKLCRMSNREYEELDRSGDPYGDYGGCTFGRRRRHG